MIQLTLNGTEFLFVPTKHSIPEHSLVLKKI